MVNQYLELKPHRNHRLSAVRLFIWLCQVQKHVKRSATTLQIQQHNTTQNGKPAINTLLYLQHLIQNNIACKYVLALVTGLKWQTKVRTILAAVLSCKELLKSHYILKWLLVLCVVLLEIAMLSYLFGVLFFPLASAREKWNMQQSICVK